MPGIFGFKWKRGGDLESSEALIRRMAKALRHHEGVRSTVRWSGSVGLGVTGTSQAVCAEIHRDERTGTLCAISGDLYRVDGAGGVGAASGSRAAQVLIAAYARHGGGLGDAVEGDFNAVIHDPAADRLLLFNDRFGFRHTYLYEDDEVFIFSPELIAFPCHEGVSKALDEQGMADYFSFFYQLGDRTMFERIKLLPAACCLTCDERGTVRSVYWQPRYTGERGIGDLDEAVGTGYQLFRASMRNSMGDGTRFLVPLSGGLDSRLILAVALEFGCDVRTATFGGRRGHDYRVAKEVCRALGVSDHIRVGLQRYWVPWYAEELVRLGGASYGSLASTRICGFARVMGTDYDGLLNGIFGGHLSFGSPYYRRSDLDDPALAAGDVRGIVASLEGHRYENYLAGCASRHLTEMVRANRLKSIEEEWEKTAAVSDRPACRQDQLFLRNRIRRGMNCLDVNRFYYRSLLPFADYDLYRFYLSLGPDLLLGHRLYKEIFRRKLPQLARIPWSNSGVDLYREPSWLLKKRKRLKRQFIWYSRKLSRGLFEWTDQDLYMHYDRDYRRCALVRAWIERILLSDRFLDRGYFNREGISRLLQQERWGGELFHEIGKLVVFELWVRRFLDGDGDHTVDLSTPRIGMWDRLVGCRQLLPRCLGRSVHGPDRIKAGP